MKISDDIQDKIFRLIYLFETGRMQPNYGAVTILADGKGGTKQITFGKMQTTEQGNLQDLCERYVAKGGKYAKIIAKYIPMFGKAPLWGRTEFTTVLRLSGTDPAMHAAQDEFFYETYFLPAKMFFDNSGFELNLSMAVIFDSYIHSGSIPAFLRNRFRELTPAKGGNEKQWISQYLVERRAWLATHPNRLLNNTVYRMDTFLDCIKNDNWHFTEPVNVFGINKVLT
jgi:chitosanase